MQMRDAELNERQQVVLRYCDASGRRRTSKQIPMALCKTSPGSAMSICNVFGLMPHPDRACEERLGSSDGRRIFESMIGSLVRDQAAA